MNENKRKGIKNILLFLRCFRLEKCLQLPAAGRRKPSPLLPLIFCSHRHPSRAAAEWHGIFIKYHQRDRREGKGHSRRLETQQTGNLKLFFFFFKNQNQSLSSLIVSILFQYCGHGWEDTKELASTVGTSNVVMGYYFESNGKSRMFFEIGV